MYLYQIRKERKRLKIRYERMQLLTWACSLTTLLSVFMAFAVYGLYESGTAGFMECILLAAASALVGLLSQSLMQFGQHAGNRMRKLDRMLKRKEKRQKKALKKYRAHRQTA